MESEFSTQDTTRQDCRSPPLCPEPSPHLPQAHSPLTVASAQNLAFSDCWSLAQLDPGLSHTPYPYLPTMSPSWESAAPRTWHSCLAECTGVHLSVCLAPTTFMFTVCPRAAPRAVGGASPCNVQQGPKAPSGTGWGPSHLKSSRVLTSFSLHAPAQARPSPSALPGYKPFCICVFSSPGVAVAH